MSVISRVRTAPSQETLVRAKKRKLQRIPRLRVVEWIGGAEVRLFFSSHKVVEVVLPWVADARGARMTDGGAGLDPGDGKDVSAADLAYASGTAKLPGVVLRPGRRGWVGS